MGDDRNPAFDEKRRAARALLEEESVTAFYVGVVRDGETVDTAFAQTADSTQEGLQPLSLLATHVRLVANEAGVDPATVAGDAATLAGRMSELSPEELTRREDETE